MPHLHADAVGLQGPAAVRHRAAGASDRRRQRRRRPTTSTTPAGQRVRKVTERQNGDAARTKSASISAASRSTASTTATAATVTLERETLHVMDDKQRIALVETRTSTGQRPAHRRNSSATSSAITSARPAWSWTTQAQIISYEEYYPYGSTSYQAVRSQTETARSGIGIRARSGMRRRG